MTVQNYIAFAEYIAQWPVRNHSSYIVAPVIKEHPVPSDRQNYCDATYKAEDYVA